MNKIISKKTLFGFFIITIVVLLCIIYTRDNIAQTTTISSEHQKDVTIDEKSILFTDFSKIHYPERGCKIKKFLDEEFKISFSFLDCNIDGKILTAHKAENVWSFGSHDGANSPIITFYKKENEESESLPDILTKKFIPEDEKIYCGINTEIKSGITYYYIGYKTEEIAKQRKNPMLDFPSECVMYSAFGPYGGFFVEIPGDTTIFAYVEGSNLGFWLDWSDSIVINSDFLPIEKTLRAE